MAINAKTLKVTFGTAVEDTTKAVFEVKKASVKINTSEITWNEAKTEATIVLASRLSEGTYNVSVTGLSDAALTGSAEVKAEAVQSITILSEELVLDASNDTIATVGYTVENQYGEDVTARYTLTGVAAGATVDVTDKPGVAKVTFTSAPKVGDKVTLVLVEKDSATTVTKELTVSSAASIKEMSVVGLYNADAKELNEDSAVEDFFLEISAKDQYGNPLDAAALTASGVILSAKSSNPTVVGVDEISNMKDSDNKTVLLPLADGLKTGTTTVTLISNTGVVASYDVTVKDGLKVDTITLQQPELAVQDEKVEIPFIAYDMDGNEVTTYKAFAGVKPTGAKIEKDAATGNAKLVIDSAEATNVVTVLTATNKVATITVTAKEAAVPSVIAGVKETVIPNLLAEETLSLALSDIMFKDQYGRDFDMSSLWATTAGTAEANKYQLVIEEQDDNDTVSTDVQELATSATSTTITAGSKKGTETLTLKLQKGNSTPEWEDVANSEFELKVTVSEAAEFASYEIADMDKIYDDGSTSYKKDLVVYGVKSNGTKVVLPAAEYTVTTDNANLTYATGKLDANDVIGDDNKDVTVKVTVVVDTEDAPTIITKDVVVTNEAPKITTAKWATATNATVVNGVLKVAAANVATITNLTAALELKDQYGEVLTFAGTITITNIVEAEGSDFAVSNNGKSNASIANAAANDTFTLTLVQGGNAYTIPVVVIA